nr:non-ribosomal peptide synthetase [Acidobacteriota bacterium]
AGGQPGIGEEGAGTRAAAAPSLRRLLAAQAARAPRAVALVSGDEELTYAELQTRVGHLARRLRLLGVGPEVLVGVAFTRGPAMIVALLAVLESGGAYLPLDPSYPRERLSLMLADARPRVLLTEERVAGGLAAALPEPPPVVVVTDREALLAAGGLESAEVGGLKLAASGGLELANVGGLAPADQLADAGSTEPAATGGPELANVDGREIIDAGSLRPADAGSLELAPLAAADPESPVYVIYTSGSTGTPKGVVVGDGALSSFVRTMAGAMRLSRADRVLQFASLAFDASAVQIFPTLSCGAALVLHPDPAGLSGVELLALCERHGITVLDLPAALWRQWVEEMAAGGYVLPPGLRTFMTGGESLSREILGRWARLVGPSTRFLSSYGPTEATVTTTLFGLTAAQVSQLPARGTGDGAEIGTPLPGVRVHLADRHLQRVPQGVGGEIVIGGAGLARGYLGRPDLTAERFVPDPLSGAAGGRLYRTGDLARYRPDGTLEFLGRTDDQVKIRGFRVEPGEVEAALAAHPAIRHAAVLVREEAIDPARPSLVDRRLAAFAVPAPEGAELSAGQLRAYLRERLPDYMVPASIVLLASLPTTPGGKVDRRALLELGLVTETEVPELGTALPRSGIEEALAVVWARLLGLARVGGNENFYDLGGHSLLATRLISRVRELFAVELPLRDLFEAPTVAGLALRIAAARRREAGLA